LTFSPDLEYRYTLLRETQEGLGIRHRTFAEVAAEPVQAHRSCVIQLNKRRAANDHTGGKR